MDVKDIYPGPAGAAGTGLFASRDFAAGELVLRVESEVVSVLDSGNLGAACERCFLTQEDVEEGKVIRLKKCGRCGVVRFCGENCQTSSWKHHHKYECKIYKRLYPKVLPNTVRTLIQILLRHQNDALPPSEWEAFMKLQHHIDDFKARGTNSEDENTWENIQLIARAAKEYSRSKVDLGMVEQMMGRILINSFTLVTPTFVALGLSLAPTVALVNHSCNPNATISFSGPTLSLRCLLAIPKSTQILICYIDATNTPPVRRADLHSRYFFTCACPMCSTSPPKTLGRVDPTPALLAALPLKDLEQLDLRARRLMEASKTPELLAIGQEARIKPLKDALQLFAPHKAYPMHRQPFAAVRAELMAVLVTAQRWVLALIHTLIGYFHIDPFQLPVAIHPLRVLHKWFLLKLVMQIVALDQDGDTGVSAMEKKWGLDWGVVIWGLLMEVEGSVGGSHGMESRFTARVKREWERFRVDTRPRWGNGGPGMGKIEREWGKLRKVADEGAEWWERWENGRVG